MMIKTQALLEITKGERVYRLILAADSPLGEVLDVLYQMKGYVVEKINEAQKSEAPKSSEDIETEEKPQE
jgi:hypothetical protein